MVRRRIAALAPVGTLLWTAGCSTTGSEAPLAACDVLTELAPSSPELGPDETQAGAVTLGTSLRSGLLQADPRQVIVYLDPADPGGLKDLGVKIEDQPGVQSTRAIGVDATYELFLSLFSDQDEIIENVVPEDLPTSVEVRTDSADAAVELEAWASALPEVFEVSGPTNPPQGGPGASMLTEADRTDWRSLAEKLRQLDGQPEWASASAAILDKLLDDGPEAVGADPDLLARVAPARDGLNEALRSCAPDAPG